MLQYELCVQYIYEVDNMVVDALLCLPPKDFNTVGALAPHVIWASGVNMTMAISTDSSVLHTIQEGYKLDPSCDHLFKTNTLGTTFINGLWYVGNHLLVPRVGEI